MASTTSRAALVALTGLLTALSSLNTVIGVRYFQSSHKLLTQARIDPIVAPGGTSKHVHKFVGANTLSDTVTYESLRAATMTTAEVSDDKSLYWQPTMYWKDGSGKFHLMQEEFGLEVYWFGRYEQGEVLVDMPGGLRMTAGDPSRSTYDASSLEDQEIGFSCYCMGLEGSTCNVPAGGPDQYKSFAEVKSFACDVVRLETMFPSCWNGVDEDSSDHKSHMAYSGEGKSCPSSHPHRIPTVFLEGWYYTDKINWPEEGDLVLSTGDTVGYSIHGDFFNGWGEGDGTPGSSELVRALNDCPEMNGAAKNCPTFTLGNNVGVTPVNDIFSEEIGTGGVALDKLLGNNALWGAGGAPAGGSGGDSSSSAEQPSASAVTTEAGAGVPSAAASAPSSAVETVAEASGAPTTPGDYSVDVTSAAVPPVAETSVVAPIQAAESTPVAVPTTAPVSTGRYRGGYRGGRSSTLPVNNAYIAQPSANIIGHNFAVVDEAGAGATQPTGTCNMQKRAVRSRARQQL